MEIIFQRMFLPGPGYDRPPTPGHQPDKESPIEKYRKEHPAEEDDDAEYENVPEDMIKYPQKQGE